MDMKDRFCHHLSDSAVIRATFLLTHSYKFACEGFVVNPVIFLAHDLDPLPTPQTPRPQGPCSFTWIFFIPFLPPVGFKSNKPERTGSHCGSLADSEIRCARDLTHVKSARCFFPTSLQRDCIFLANFSFPSLFMHVSGEHEIV